MSPFHVGLDPELVFPTNSNGADEARTILELQRASEQPVQHATVAAEHTAPFQTQQISQPPVSKMTILILQNTMEELAQLVASFNSEPFEKYLISQAVLDSLDSLEEKKQLIEDKIARLQRVLDSKMAPLPAKQETSICEVQPNQGQSRQTGTALIPTHQKDRKRKLHNSLLSNINPQDGELPFRRVREEEFLHHCVPSECQQKLQDRLDARNEKEKEGKGTWKLNPVEFLSWCCYYIRWAYQNLPLTAHTICGKLLYIEFSKVYGERRGCSRMIGICPKNSLFTIKHIMMAARNAWQHELTDESLMVLLNPHPKTQYQHEQQIVCSPENRSSNDDEGTSNEDGVDPPRNDRHCRRHIVPGGHNCGVDGGAAGEKKRQRTAILQSPFVPGGDGGGVGGAVPWGGSVVGGGRGYLAASASGGGRGSALWGGSGEGHVSRDLVVAGSGGRVAAPAAAAAAVAYD
jgi:hypothetical protein